MVSSLKSFIKSVRAAKTIADERSVIRKESAKIRTHFRDVNLDHTSRRVLISKLLYLYILGEPTYFGQVECIKLLASPKFLDKKLGYMAASLLLDENQEVLTLLTNSLNNDMNHSNQFVVGLALTTLGNIASPELARDLYTDVEKIIVSPNSFLRKKSAMCAARLIEKDPDLSEIFVPKLKLLISHGNHGVLLGVLKMIDIIYKVDDSNHDYLIKKISPKVLDHLKKLVSSGYSPDYDVNGIPDPFLFCALLTTLRNLLESFQDGPELELFNDLLTQIASKIDSTKNSGHAILYEAVKTIFHIQSDPSLKVLGVNILGKFLTAKDNNTRYVALNSLLTVVTYEPQAVQRHRSTILACLIDADISIRRRALELSFGILNEQNIRVITKELLTFLDNNDTELKSYVTTQLTLACEKYSPNSKWHFETLIKMLKVAGNHITTDILSNILALIMQNKDQELTKHLLLKLYQLSNETGQQQYGLNVVASWCLGEYSDLILNQVVEDVKITEDSIVSLLLRFIDSTSTLNDQSNAETLVSYILTAILKLSIKFQNPAELEKLRQILIRQQSNSSLEIQIRSNEYLEIFYQDNTLKKGLLERMPAPPTKHRDAITLQKRTSQLKKSTHSSSSGTATTATTEDLLLDLMGDDDNGANFNSTQPQASKYEEPTMDLLSDIFGTNTAPKTETTQLVNTTTLSKPSPPADLVIAHESNNVKVGFKIVQIGNGEASIDAYILSKAVVQLSSINLLIAVPKSQKLKMQTISSNVLNSRDDFSKQNLNITGKVGAKIKLRVKLNYEFDQQPLEEQFDFGGFDKTL